MCGISGIIGNDWEESSLDKMITCQIHRGPNNSAKFVDESKFVGLGHNRLSIQDLREEANCPMTDNSGNLTLIFNGEIYNFIELREQLKEYTFKTSSDTEVILAAYLKWGKQCVTKFIGMFALAIWDNKNHSLFCSRDRLGIKPFYYYYKNNTLIFASEIKSILAAKVKAEPNWNQWSDYLRFGAMDHSHETFFKDIYMLPAGHNLLLHNFELSFQRYWNVEDASIGIDTSDLKQSTDYLYSLLTDTASLHLRSDVPVSVNLSGGIDSNLLALLIDKHTTSDTCYSFTSSFEDKTYDEYQYVKTLKLNNITKLSTLTNFEDIPTLAYKLTKIQEAPFGGVPTIAYYKLHQSIKEHKIPVSLEGQGIDELFGGYTYTHPYHYADIVKTHGWTFLLQEYPNAAQYRKVIESIIEGHPETVSQDGTSHLRTQAINKEHLSNKNEQLKIVSPYSDNLRDTLYKDLFHTKLPRVLRMNDKLSMSQSIELREPFLDHRIVEFAFNLDNNLKINRSGGKFIIRHLMQNLTGGDSSYIKKLKMSVVTPQTTWLQNELSGWVESILNSQSFKTRGIFDTQVVKSLYADFKTHGSNNSSYIWQWINTELWFQTFIDQAI
ncbi:MAG TPA: asparagine synthase (glutamine-hydrolyzing) [Dehalococcoidia bacterium]|nr:asparagine synthase (glutamine-hydrolyzing) [Dehalococcoidia bacterium]